MEQFSAFLKSSSKFLKSLPAEFKNIHFTLGNESCDLDSSIGALLLAYYFSKQDKEKVVVPILNVRREDFSLRTEICFVLHQADISLNDLVFRDEVNFEEILSTHNVSISLLDHHILSKNDAILAPNVIEIFDHRPIDCSYFWAPEKVRIRIEPVGSCCTLITDEILNGDKTVLTKPLAYLLYQTIIYDTIALKPENHKATELDIKIGTELEKSYGFTEDRQILFDILWEAHNDVSGLTPRQLLNKDLKLVEGVYIPGLPMLVEQFLDLEGSMNAVEAFADEYKVSCILLVGLNASEGTVRRDLGIFSKYEGDELRKSILQALENDKQHDFKFEQRKTKYNGKIYLLHVHNIKLSRKQLVPIVKDAWKHYVSRI